MTNVERLENEGLLNTEFLTDEQRDLINQKLTEQEIKTLIDIKGKLNFFDWPIRPMMF
ncbi:aroma-sacti cluster domain-containing protein [Mesorhizobium sp. YM1C-6-2]|jgi:hypothetical protein|uniref:aroma-sacti cluster domain-containing protein n=1 Tax=Mesorhizobium sp. YM1C-6-2 TaxID=1827501 RepID=UPI0015FFA362|nr:aroma-sacti cluster domain-containing protein [Mesorhizobium sp. YM1C-6-2]